jgi:hypothetical protein
MYSTTLLALAVAGLAGQAIAGPHHGLQHLHQKKALVTEKTTVTDWVTVTVTLDETSTSTSTSASLKTFYTVTRKYRPQPSFQHPSHSTALSTSLSTSQSTSESTSSSAVPPPAPTTTAIPQVTSTSAVPEQNTPPTVAAVPSSSSAPEVVNSPSPTPPVPSSTSQAAPQASSPTSQEGNGSGSTGSGVASKRGLVYNNPQLLTRFLNSGTKVSWAYNWGQYDDSGTNLEFCPMLWGLKLDFAQTWPGNAQKAIDAGSKCLLSFNEPDLGEQANLSPQVAAQKHIELMNPFKGKALIGSPAITNSGAANQGIDWLTQWFKACGGNCAVDFVNIHIYGVDTTTFLTHLRNVHAAFNLPVWITEFAFNGSDDQINTQLETVIGQIETNPTYSFVDRYSYFMVSDGVLVSGNSISTYGNTFAYGA